MERLGEALDVVLELAVGAEELHVGAILKELAGVTLLDIILPAERSETPVLGDNNLLATREPK